MPEVRESRTTRKQDASPVQMSDVYQEGGIEDLLPGKILLNYHGKRTSPVPVGKKNISSWLRKEAEKAVAADSEMLVTAFTWALSLESTCKKTFEKRLSWLRCRIL